MHFLETSWTHCCCSSVDVYLNGVSKTGSFIKYKIASWRAVGVSECIKVWIWYSDLFWYEIIHFRLDFVCIKIAFIPVMITRSSTEKQSQTVSTK